MTPEFPPPYVPLAELDRALSDTGFALLDSASVSRWLAATPAEWRDLQQAWDELPPDEYLKDGGRYRKRRHSCFVVDGERVDLVPHRAHWQPVEYNALHGGMQRWFQPMLPQTLALPLWQRLLVRLGEAASALRGTQPWYTEAHTFRIDTAGGIGRPTPEGAHRDGVDLVAVFLVARQGIKGGESRVFEAHGPRGQRFTLQEPWSLLLLDDQRVIHETTPIQPAVPDAYGWRDTLVVTCRAGGFPGDRTG
ncbi:2OG-Fe dioxygenase family protein [Hydrogenophaga sp.]|jgi:hypothetical protein|uniref:2OG-Fe dioxygenase family protein n=1 Tax=Hydrogenophaga sp. TaxID=1904254 RepID=UPI0035AED993